MNHLLFLSLLALCTQWSDLLLLFLSVQYSLGEFLYREFRNVPVALLDLVKTDSSCYLWVESVPDYPMRMNSISRATCDWFRYEHVTSNGLIIISPRMFSPEPAGEALNVFSEMSVDHIISTGRNSIWWRRTEKVDYNERVWEEWKRLCGCVSICIWIWIQQHHSGCTNPLRQKRLYWNL